MPPKHKLIVLLGPTAVGKTEFALKIAKKLHTEIISGDSETVYRGFDIGAAKPSRAELAAVPHRLIDVLDGGDRFSVSDFCRLAAGAINAANGAGKIPLLCGGTGLYIQALLEGYKFNTTAGDENFRKEIFAAAERFAASFDDKPAAMRRYLVGRLSRVDGDAAERLKERDFRRLIRAVEVAENGENISRERLYRGGLSDGQAEDSPPKNIKPQDAAKNLVYDACVIGLRRERAALYERINRRVDKMLADGFVAEVEGLFKRGISREAQAMKAIGYREAAAYLNGETDYDGMARLIKQHTRNFAKRQLTWYRRMAYIEWIDLDGGENAALAKILGLVKGYFDYGG